MSSSMNTPATTLRQQLEALLGKAYVDFDGHILGLSRNMIREGADAFEELFDRYSQEIAREATQGASEKPTPQEQASNKQVANRYLVQLLPNPDGASMMALDNFGAVWWLNQITPDHKSVDEWVLKSRGIGPNRALLDDNVYTHKSLDTTAAGNDLPSYDPKADIEATLRRKGQLTQKPPQPKQEENT